MNFGPKKIASNDQITLLLYCCDGVKSHRSGSDAVLLIGT